MHRIIQKGKLLGLTNKMQNSAKFLKLHAGQIVYYACVALVLTAIGIAAERFRGGTPMEEALILPAVELNVPVIEEVSFFEMQEEMRILRKFSDTPEWNDALCQWETHAATDYLSMDQKVYSISDGTITTIGKSGIYGGFVEVETEGYLIRYASLEPVKMIEVGDRIKKGTMIGYTDASMPGEKYIGNHLHLELLRNGTYLDFEKEKDKKASAVD